MCSSHTGRVSVKSPSSQSHLNFFQIESRFSRVESKEMLNHFELLVCKHEWLSSHMKLG